MTMIHAHQLRPGDVVQYGGRCHKISRVERRDGWAWPVAADDTGWAIALDRYLIAVHRAAGDHLLGELEHSRPKVNQR